MMTDLKIKLIYNEFLTDKFNKNEISRGKMALLRISEAAFEAFKKEYELNGNFKSKVDTLLLRN